VVVPGVVPQWTANAKYSRNCTASVRYKCNPGPALMRERKENEGLDRLDEVILKFAGSGRIHGVLDMGQGASDPLWFLGGPEMGHWGHTFCTEVYP
jgi:hypothetical protein